MYIAIDNQKIKYSICETTPIVMYRSSTLTGDYDTKELRDTVT